MFCMHRDVAVKTCQVWIEMCEGGTLEMKEPSRVAKCSRENVRYLVTLRNLPALSLTFLFIRVLDQSLIAEYSHYITVTFSLLSQPITHKGKRVNVFDHAPHICVDIHAHAPRYARV